ncbi:MAG: hypothetical protein J6T00_03260 [Bacteroidaceae bacterium]|nr:hypothetical protein [Bacteroidaceae bacterium]
MEVNPQWRRSQSPMVEKSITNGGEVNHQWWRSQFPMVEKSIPNGGEVNHQWHLAKTIEKNQGFKGFERILEPLAA